MVAGEPLPPGATPRMEMLVELATLVTNTPWKLSRTHRDRAHAVGLGDDELLHAIALSAYFGHLNRVADATGVPLDYQVQLQPAAADPSVPALAPAPVMITARPIIDLAHRAATAAALTAWRAYVFERDAPLPRRQRTFIARWVAVWLGDGGISSPDDLTQNPLDDGLRALAEVVTLAPWQLGDHSYAELRRVGFSDAAIFDVVITASTAGMLSRIAVALAALGRERT